MVNYAITTHETVLDSVQNVLALLETYLETIDNTKTIYLLELVPYGGSWKGVVIHAT